MRIDIFHPVNTQHYVPRHYLSAWARRITKKDKNIDLICARIKGDLKQDIDTMTIGQAEHFYAYPDLSQEELEFIVKYLGSRKDLDGRILKSVYQYGLFIPLYLRCLKGERSEDLRKEIGILDDSGVLSRELRKVLKEAWLLVKSDEIDELFRQVISETEVVKNNGFEHWMTLLEVHFNPLLDEARKGDLSFVSRRGMFPAFTHNLINQMLRTRKYDEICRVYKTNDIWTSETVLGFLRHQAAYDVSSRLMKSSDVYELSLIENTTELEFITGDQPVCNLCCGPSNDNLDLYFPISPVRAICFAKRGRFKGIYSYLARPDVHEVDKLNKLICGASLNQLYSRAVDTLRVGNYYASRWRS